MKMHKSEVLNQLHRFLPSRAEMVSYEIERNDVLQTYLPYGKRLTITFRLFLSEQADSVEYIARFFYRRKTRDSAGSWIGYHMAQCPDDTVPQLGIREPSVLEASANAFANMFLELPNVTSRQGFPFANASEMVRVLGGGSKRFVSEIRSCSYTADLMRERSDCR